MAKNNYFETFCKVSKVLGQSQEKDKVLDLIVQSAVETMNGKAACLFLLDGEKELFVERAQTGLSKTYLHADPIQAKTIEKNFSKERYFSVYDATTDPGVSNHEIKKKEGIASILVVPVKVNEVIIGVLTLYTATHRKFKKEEIDFLTALAEQGGIALEQARLIGRIRENTRIFHQMASSINASLDIKEILHKLTETLSSTLNMKGVSIRLLNKETGEMPIVASHGLSDEFLYKKKGSIQKKVDTTLNGETIVIEDMSNDKRVTHLSDIEKEGISSAIFVPIKTSNEVVGIMRLFGGSKRIFSPETIELVNALAEQGGLAIQNASMVLMLQEDNKNLKEDMWVHKSWF